jgi:cytochrome c553
MGRLLMVVLAAIALDAMADAKAGEKKAQLCLLCHKPGNVMASAPFLEAQPVEYLIAATTAYKNKTRPDPVMQANVANLSARDIRDIANYFSTKPFTQAAYSPDLAKVSAGEAVLRQRNCAACHQAGYKGMKEIPRLAGQLPAYLVQQLEAFVQKRRSHPPADMPATASDVENTASYLASLQ